MLKLIIVFYCIAIAMQFIEDRAAEVKRRRLWREKYEEEKEKMRVHDRMIYLRKLESQGKELITHRHGTMIRSRYRDMDKIDWDKEGVPEGDWEALWNVRELRRQFSHLIIKNIDNGESNENNTKVLPNMIETSSEEEIHNNEDK